MKFGWKGGIALVIGGLALGGVVSAVAQSGDSSSVNIVRPAGFGARGGGPGHGFGMKGPLVRSEAVVEGDEDGTFRTVRVDRGELTAIEGNELTIKEADGQVVHVGVVDSTHVFRDGQNAKVSDLKTGDHVSTHRTRNGSAGYVTQRVVAISAERYKELEERRAACERDASQCRGVGRARRPGMFRGGDVAPAPAAAGGPGDEAAA